MLKRGDGRPSVWPEAPEGAREAPSGADPIRFFRGPVVGHEGSAGIRLDRDPGWDEVPQQFRRGFRLIAPKRLAAQVAG